MNRWEYAAGTYHGGWVANSRPSSFEEARVAQHRLLATYSGDLGIDPRIIRRCERFPEWQLVEDHAADLLAEAMQELANELGNHRADLVQGYDLYRTLSRLASGLLARTESEEFD